MATPACADCQRPMEGGFLLETGDHGSLGAVAWMEGGPEKSFWSGLKTRGRRRIPLYAWRCPGCQQVRLYAPA